MNSSTPTPHDNAPALDCRRSGVLIPHRPEYGRPPFTVECWVRGGSHDESFAGFDQGWSLRHWQFTIGSDGRFGVMLNRQLPRTLWCSSDCRDGKWHHLAFTSDGQKVRLFCDGAPGEEALITEGATSNEVPGSLWVGTPPMERSGAIFSGQVHSLRISAGIRDITVIGAGSTLTGGFFGGTAGFLPLGSGRPVGS